MRYDYIRTIISSAKAGNIRQFIRFNTAFHHVDFDDKKNEFNVDIEDLITTVVQ
jgi:cation diffusion facilitator CzcD-associated flavoprotein CzcO